MIPLELIREFERQMKSLRIGGTPLVRAQKLEKVLTPRHGSLDQGCFSERISRIELDLLVPESLEQLFVLMGHSEYQGRDGVPFFQLGIQGPFHQEIDQFPVPAGHRG